MMGGEKEISVASDFVNATEFIIVRTSHSDSSNVAVQALQVSK
jgi:hypothetical protein